MDGVGQPGRSTDRAVTSIASGEGKRLPVGSHSLDARRDGDRQCFTVRRFRFRGRVRHEDRGERPATNGGLLGLLENIGSTADHGFDPCSVLTRYYTEERHRTDDIRAYSTGD